MMYNVRLLRGLREPVISAQQLVKAEKITGFWKKLTLLFFITLLIAAATAYFGIGNEFLSKQLNSLSGREFEGIKSLFAIGQILLALFIFVFMITIPSLFFWAISDIEWKKFIVLQLYVWVIFLVEKVVTALFTITIGLPDISNPFSLGVIGQAITSNGIALQLLAQITIFKIGTVVLQYKYIRILSGRSPKFTALAVMGFNLILLLASVFIGLMDLEKLL